LTTSPYQLWLDNGKPIIYCGCSCGGKLIPKPDWKWHGIPRYIRGHNTRVEPYHGLFITGNQINKGRIRSEEAILKTAMSNRGQHRSVEQKKKISDNHADFSLEKHPNWKGGYKLKCKRSNASRRGLSWIPLNECLVDGWEGHHLDNEYVIYTPRELHHSIPHNVFTGKNMDEINFIVLQWYGLYYWMI